MNLLLKPIQSDSDALFARNLIFKESNNGHFSANPIKAIQVILATAIYGYYELPCDKGYTVFNHPDNDIVKTELHVVYDGNDRVGIVMANGTQTKKLRDNPADISWGDPVELLMLAIDQRHKRKGYGSAAVTKTIELLREQGVKQITVRAKQKSTFMASLLLKLGFELVSENERGTKTFKINLQSTL